MLDFQVQQFPFRFGLSEGVEPHQVQPGTLTEAENVVWKKDGSVEKRFGTVQTTTAYVGSSASSTSAFTGNITAAKRLFTRGTELGLIDGTWTYAYSQGASSWRRVSQIGDVGVTWTTIADTAAGVMSTDTALSSSGLLVHAWVTGDPFASTSALGALIVQVVDQATGTVLYVPRMLSTQNNFGVRVLTIGTTAIILTRNGAASPYTLNAYTLDLSTFAVSSSVALRVDHATAGGFAGYDACVIGSNFVVAYNRTGPVVALESYNASLVSQASGSISGEASGCSMISIDGASGEVLYVFYCQAVATPRPVRVAIANPSTLAQTVAPVTVEAPPAGSTATQVAVVRFDATHAFVMYGMVEGTSVSRTSSYRVTSVGAVETSARGTWWGAPLSRPFVLGGKCYAVLADLASTAIGAVGTTLNASTNSALVELETGANVIADWVPHRYVGKVEALIAGVWPTSMPLPSVAALSATSSLVASPFLATAAPQLYNWRQGARLLTVTAGASLPVDMWRATSYGGEAYVLGAGLFAYDGRAVFDYGFPRCPWLRTLTTSDPGGAVAAGAYIYGGVQEYRSNVGVLHRSPTWTGGSITAAGGASINSMSWAGYSFGCKQSNWVGFGEGLPTRIAVYRSTVGGSVFQRLSYEPAFNVVSAVQSLSASNLNDSRADSDITSTGAGMPLSARPVIYTTGGILDDEQPPAGVTMFQHADRLWVLAGDQKTWWYSKAFQDDLGVAPGFSPTFRISFADTQVAGASMDDKAVFFSASGIRYMLGTGPAPTGLNSDFQTPTTIQTDVGCTNARSVVSTPDGVMFLSDRGIYLLSRGLEPVWIGRPVKDKLALFPNVTSAVLIAKQNQVRFTCTNVAGTASLVLVYDYVEKQWSTFKYWVDNTCGGVIVDAIMWNGSYAVVGNAGVVYVETTASYLDASGSYYVPMTLETAWISGPLSSLSPSAGPLKFQSVRSFGLNGTSHTDHDLTVDVGFDSNTTYQQTKTFLGTSAATAVGDLEECGLTIGTHRKCGSIRFRITDGSPTAGTVGTGQGPSFYLMALEVGNKRGLVNTSAAKRG